MGRGQRSIINKIIKKEVNMYYCADLSGYLHFGQTLEEASREAAVANREIR